MMGRLKKMRDFCGQKTLKKLWQDESAQGATEYILILVVIVAVALLFGDEFKQAISTKIKQLSSEINNFSVN